MLSPLYLYTIDTAEGTIDFSGYQLMIPAGIKDELVYAGSNDGVDYNNTNSRGTGEGRALIMMMLGLWNNAKYWSKFGEMLDIGLPVEDSHQMAKEYVRRRRKGHNDDCCGGDGDIGRLIHSIIQDGIGIYQES